MKRVSFGNHETFSLEAYNLTAFSTDFRNESALYLA